MLSIFKQTSTPYPRVRGFCKDKVLKCFDLLVLHKKFSFSVNRLFNIDETGFSVVQRGKQQVGAFTAAERGFLITFVAYMSAAGDSVPPWKA